MELQRHIEAGRIIKAVLRSDQRPFRVYMLMNSLRSTLEDWMSLELDGGQLKGSKLFEVYYTETKEDFCSWETAKSQAGIIAMLNDLKRELQDSYPDSAPLRQQLRRIDRSVSLVGKMKSVD